MGEGAEHDTLSTCEERQVKDKTVIPIVGRNRERQFRTRQPETPDIGEASPGGACAIKGETATDNDNRESVAMDKSEAGYRGPSSLNLKRTTVKSESPRESGNEEGGDEKSQFVTT